MSDTAQTAIMNTALGLLGQEPVGDLGEASLQRSISATKLRRHLKSARDTVLRRHGWVCALEYIALEPAVISGYSNFRYPYVFQLPGDAVHVWEIEGVGAAEGCWAPRWQVGTIDTDGDGANFVVRARDASGGLNVVYVRRGNWAALDVHLADAIAYQVAARGCVSVTGDKTLARALAQEAEQKALMAISTDATQEGNQPSLAPSIPAMIRNCAR